MLYALVVPVQSQPFLDRRGAGKRRVQASRGQVTYSLRSEWGLNAILGDGDVKTRDDHRHHAVDAVVVALTTPGAVKRLSDAAQRATQERRKRFGKVKEPWAGFADDVRRSGRSAAPMIDRIIPYRQYA